MRQRGTYSVNASQTRQASGGFHERIMLKLVRASRLVPQCRNQVSVYPYLARGGMFVHIYCTRMYNTRSILHACKVESRDLLSFSLYVYFFPAWHRVRRILSEALTWLGPRAHPCTYTRSMHVHMCVCPAASLPRRAKAKFPFLGHTFLHPSLRCRDTRDPCLPLLSAGGATFKGHWMRPWMK